MSTIEFRDNGKFLQVLNHITNVTAFVHKSGIVIRQDNPNSFFIKNDSYIDYFQYSTVAVPVTATIEELVGLLVTMAQSERESIPVMEDIKMSENILELTVPYNKNPLEIAEIGVLDASSTHNLQTTDVAMNIAPVDGSRLVRQSKEYISIPGGKTVIGVMSGTLIDATNITNVVSRIGMFDDPNDINAGAVINGYGIFYEYNSDDFANGGGCSLVLRTTNAVGVVNDTQKIPQADWNLDSADGLGLSAVVLDPTMLNTFVFAFGNIYGMSISAGIMYNGRAVMVHEFVLPVIYNYATRVPLRWEIQSVNGAPSEVATMIQKNASVYASTKQIVEYKYFSSSSSLSKNITLVGQSEPLMSLRLKNTCIRAKLRPKTINLLNTSPGGVGKWELRLNPTLTDAAFASVHPSSFSEVSTVETHATQGIILCSGYISDVGEKQIQLPDTNKILATIEGDSDVITLVIHLLQGSLTTMATVEWQEFE